MDPFAGLEPYLPEEWLTGLRSLPDTVRERVQEIRLYADGPVTVSTPQREWYLTRGGCSSLRQPDGIYCSQRMVEHCFLRFCRGSVYAYEEELKQGFLPLPGGYRVGIAGTAVRGANGVTAIRRVTSLCVRIPREHRGCSRPLWPYLMSAGRPVSGVLVGEPSSGKTSLLRDLAAAFAGHGKRVALVDERGELAGTGAPAGCHVLSGYPKADGLLQAVRCLAPQVVLFDELGDPEEIEAVVACCHAGVAVIASLHGESPEAVAHRPVTMLLAKTAVFSRWIFLTGRSHPGQIKQCLIPEVIADEVVWTPAHCGGGEWIGDVLFPAAVPACHGAEPDRKATGCVGGTARLYG